MEPRILQLAYDIEKGISSETAVPAAFQACSEARVVLSKEHQLLFSYVTRNQSNFWINLDLDIIYLSGATSDQSKPLSIALFEA